MTQETWQKILDLLQQEEKLCDKNTDNKKDKVKWPKPQPYEDFPEYPTPLPEYPEFPGQPNTGNYGWICPRCGRGNSPSSTRCGCLDTPNWTFTC